MTTEKQTCNCGCMGLGPIMSTFMRQVMPETAHKHFQQSRVEFLKGIRALIDARIDHLSRSASPGTSVPVE